MSAITAAVVGVILNLAIWFGLHTLFAEVAQVSFGNLRLDIPELQSAVPAAIALSGAAAIALFRFKTSVITTLFGCAIAGMLWTLVMN